VDLSLPMTLRAFQALPLAVALVAGCGAGPDAQVDFHVRGVGVAIRSQAAFTTRPDLAARLESTVDAALDYWGGDWPDLRQLTISLEDGRYVECRGHASATACLDGSALRVSTQDLGTTYTCVEQTALVHEIGHAVIGDPDHADPRWMDFEPVARRLDGRAGYSAAGEVDCPIFLSVWRHVLRVP
jgi:hypothetical protein